MERQQDTDGPMVQEGMEKGNFLDVRGFPMVFKIALDTLAPREISKGG